MDNRITAYFRDGEIAHVYVDQKLILASDLPANVVKALKAAVADLCH
jgi:hypothetical protein